MHKWISILLLFQVSSAQASLFGEENVPLFQLVVGQVQEIERLAELIGAAKNQVEAIKSLNAGINKTVDQIQAIEVIIDRAQGVDPTSIKSIAELNDYLERVQDVKARMDDLMGIRVKAAEIGITQSSIQGDTAYKMGQEMISTGSTLANESRNATPGRAAQISAASGSAQMVAKGVELQTMAQMVQLQALSLDLQRSQIDREMTARKMNQNLFINTLKSSSSRKLQ